jgi:hypothetical protein
MKRTFFVILTAFICAFACIQVFSRDSIQFSEPEPGVYVVAIDSGYFYKNSLIYLSDELATVDEVAKEKKAKVAINGGFFDPNNAKTTSFVLIDGKIVADPQKNESLTNNPELQPHMGKILNRSEFRVMQCGIRKKIDIVKHYAPVDAKCVVRYSLQAGPRLLPSFRLADEFFVLKEDGKVIRQSAGSLEKCARSAIGLKEGKVYLIAVDKDHGMTLPELAKLVDLLGMEKAMAFDGGSSTSLNVNLPGTQFSLVSAGEGAGRKVKTILLVD